MDYWSIRYGENVWFILPIVPVLTWKTIWDELSANKLKVWKEIKQRVNVVCILIDSILDWKVVIHVMLNKFLQRPEKTVWWRIIFFSNRYIISPILKNQIWIGVGAFSKLHVQIERSDKSTDQLRSFLIIDRVSWSEGDSGREPISEIEDIITGVKLNLPWRT